MKMPGIILLSLALSLSCTGNTGPDNPPQEGDGKEPAVPEERALNAPGNLAIRELPEGIQLSWEDLSKKEEGYLVRKKTLADGKESQVFIPADSSSWTDVDVKTGQTVYTVQSYWHMDRSPETTVTFSRFSVPEIEMASFQSSWHMVAVGVKVLADGGEPARCGLVITREGVDKSEELACQEQVASGSTGYILAENLEAGTAYRFRPWAENRAGRIYGAERTASLQPLPEPVVLDW